MERERQAASFIVKIESKCERGKKRRFGKRWWKEVGEMGTKRVKSLAGPSLIAFEGQSRRLLEG